MEISLCWPKFPLSCHQLPVSPTQGIFFNFCLSILPLLLVCHLLHRCFSQAIARLFFKWLPPADVFQFPGVCVALSTELKLSDALDILQCRAVSLSWRVCNIAHQWHPSAPVRLLGDGFPQQQASSLSLQVALLPWLHKQLSMVPEMNFCNCCGACAQKKN